MLVREIYEVLHAMSHKDSPHRKLAVDVFVKELHSGSSDGKWMPNFDDVDSKFVRDVMVGVQQVFKKIKSGVEIEGETWWTLEDPCMYHEHATEGKCYKERRENLYLM